MAEIITVIEVGSSAIRMVIAEVGAKLAIRVLENLQKPVSFGKDVFTTGRLSHASIRQGIDIIDNFSIFPNQAKKRIKYYTTQNYEVVQEKLYDTDTKIELNGTCYLQDDDDGVDGVEGGAGVSVN